MIISREIQNQRVFEFSSGGISPGDARAYVPVRPVMTQPMEGVMEKMWVIEVGSSSLSCQGVSEALGSSRPKNWGDGSRVGTLCLARVFRSFGESATKKKKT